MEMVKKRRDPLRKPESLRKKEKSRKNPGLKAGNMFSFTIGVVKVV